MGVVQIGESVDSYLYPGNVDVGGVLRCYNNAAEALRIESAHAGMLKIKTAEAIESALTGATDTVGSNLIPAGAFVLGVVIIVTALLVGPTTITIGDGSDADKWGASIALLAGTKTTSANFTAGPSLYTSAANVVLTGTGGSFSAGGVRAAVFYVDFAGLAS